MKNLSAGLRAALTALIALSAAVPVHASETVRDRFERALRDVTSRADADPVAATLGIWEAHELASLVPGGVDAFKAAVARIATAKRAPARAPWFRAEAQLALALVDAETGAPDAAAFARAGVPTTGIVLGPLPGPTPDDPPAPAALPAAGKHGPTGWRRFAVGATPDIPLGDYMPSSGDAHVAVGFAFDIPAAPRPGKPARPARTDARIILGSNGPFVATLDGAPLASFPNERELADWQHDIAVSLAPGIHFLAISIGHRTLAPDLRVRVLLADGTAPAFITLDAPPAPAAAFPTSPTSPTPAPPATWSPASAKSAPGLAALAAKDPLRAALLLAWTEPSPPSERRAAAALEALIAKPPPPAALSSADLYYLLGKSEQTDASRAIAAYEKADSLAGGHSQALAALIDLAEKSDLSARADTLARRLASFDPKHPAVVGHALLRRFQLTDGAAALPLVPTDLPYNARLAALEATIAEGAGDLARAAAAWSRLAQSQLGDAESLNHAVSLYQRAGRRDLALAALANALVYHPMSSDLLILRARAAANGSGGADAATLTDAIAALDTMRAFHHQSPLFEEMRGRLLLLAGDRGKAIEAFDRALELAPQNRQLADYRSSLVAERGLADRWATPIEDLVKRAASIPRAQEGAIDILERNVTQVFPSGLASQFRQSVIRIDQRAAAQRYEDMAFAFTPGEDRLEILEAEVLRKAPDGSLARIRPQQVGEQQQSGKADGVYTLTAYKVVRFPSLEVGDIVHVQLRKDEIGSRNLFGDFFGVFLPMSSDIPKARAEAIVVAPADRKLYFHAAQLAPPTLTTKDGMQQLTFAADDLPALDIEPAMPGYGDVSAWVSVSTFESWEALVKWYRELVRPQIEVPPDLLATAQRLVQGLATEEERVAAIHRWVVTTTRYVGIEFGIHGFKPYKVAEVAQRGYGDCKDKAALLVAMLRAGGVPAEFVLVRTRDLGALDGTPATLWAFNHAIAYVPSMGIYLDGTAESSGLRELPELDQDAQVLRIDLYGNAPPVLTRIPIQTSDQNLVVASARFVIDASGDATADLTETIHGTSSGRLRSRLQDPTRRDGIIAEIIADQHPGTSLESASYDNLDALGQPVTIRASIRLPKLALRTGQTLDLPLVLEPGARLLQMAPLAVRKQPLVLTETELEEDTDTYVLPQGARLVAIPEPVKVTSPFGSWTAEVHMQGDEVVCTSRWELTQTRISPADYPAFRRFLEEVAKTEGARLSIDLGPSDASAP